MREMGKRKEEWEEKMREWKDGREEESKKGKKDEK